MAHQKEGKAIAKYNFKAQSPIEMSLRVVSSVLVRIMQTYTTACLALFFMKYIGARIIITMDVERSQLLV